jgi:hypothetical protein
MAVSYLPKNIQLRLFRALTSESELGELESWLNADNELENHLGPDFYLGLIASDFRTDRGRKLAKELIRSILRPVDPEVITRQQVQQLLRGMLDESIDLLTGLRELSRLHSAGVRFIPIIFVGYDSETDSIPTPDEYYLWNQEALREKLKELDRYRKAILSECGILLERLVEFDRM